MINDIKKKFSFVISTSLYGVFANYGLTFSHKFYKFYKIKVKILKYITQ